MFNCHQFEGLFHGGQAQAMRQRLTRFGSGWRGLEEAANTGGAGFFHESVVQALFGKSVSGMALSDSGRGTRAYGFLASRKQLTPRNIERYHKILEAKGGGLSLKDFTTGVTGIKTLFTEKGIHSYYRHGRALNRWSSTTGLMPTIVGVGEGAVSKFKSTVTLQHESIHATHLADPSHPFFKSSLEKAGSLRNALTKAHSSPVFEMINGPASLVVPQVESIYEANFKTISSVDPIKGSNIKDSEILAHYFQEDKTFFDRAEAAGVMTPRLATAELKKAMSLVPVKNSRMVRDLMIVGEGDAKAGVGMFRKLVTGARRMAGHL